MLSAKPTANPRRTTLPLVLLPVYVPGILSCKRMELVIYNGVNGTCNRLDPGRHCLYRLLYRYINTDYVVASVLRSLAVRNVIISYDIACKWSIHHLQRIFDNHPDLDVKNLQLSYLIPKFHLPAHGASCQTVYSFNYAKGVGRTHGETVEHGWANTNLTALSTREMGAGARHLVLDDTWSGWNWGKILGMGKPGFIGRVRPDHLPLSLY